MGRTKSKKPISRYNSQRSKNVNGDETNQRRISKFSENVYNLNNNNPSKSNNINEQSENQENQNAKHLFKSKTEKIIEGPNKKVLGDKDDININNGIEGKKANLANDAQIDTKKKKNSGCHCLVF